MNGLAEFKRPALIRGHGQARICTVITSKNESSHHAGWYHLFRPPIKILDGEDDFEDGSYELVLGAQVFTLTKHRGEYQEIAAIGLTEKNRSKIGEQVRLSPK